MTTRSAAPESASPKKGGFVECGGITLVYDDGVITPDDARGADGAGERAEGFDERALVGKPRLERPVIGGQRELEIERERQLAEARQHRRGVFRPEDGTVAV